MVVMCPLGGVCDNMDMDDYDPEESTGSGDDGATLTEKLERCRLIKCPRLGEGDKDSDTIKEEIPQKEEYASPKIDF